MLSPGFTAIICNYNYAQFVCGAVQSVLAQTYPPELLDVIVVDDGSTDNSRKALLAFQGNPRVRVITQENRGQSAAFATGVADAAEVARSWFDIVGVSTLGDHLTINQANQWFPFSIPCGLVSCFAAQHFSIIYLSA